MYKARDFSCLLGMPGFSERSLKLHFELYQGYVKNVNLLLRKLRETAPEDICFSELKRRFGWEFSGMRLHEYYFENLGKERSSPGPALLEWLAYSFGSYEAWERDFKAMGKMRGIGWAALFRDLRNGRLLNAWIEQHHQGYLAGCQPLLLMDVWEHAYLCEYGLDRAAYIEAFFQNICWKRVEKRFAFVGG